MTERMKDGISIEVNDEGWQGEKDILHLRQS